MADIWTGQVGNSYCPQMHIGYWIASQNDTSANIEWYIDYVARGHAAYTNGIARTFNINIDGQARSGSLNINGITNTRRVASGTVSVGKTHSSRNVDVSGSFFLDVTWAGAYGGWMNCSGSIGIGAKTSYAVKYNANGGSGAPGNQTKWYGENLTLSSTKPTRTGYTFAGWATSASGAVAYQPGATYTGNAAVTLYAKWTAHTYTVSYNANGGSGAPGNQTKTYGVNLTLSSTKPTRTGYTFAGWGTSASATTVAYNPGATYTGNTALALYAIWKLAWKEPRITNLAASRCNSAGTLSEEGTYAKVSFNWATDKTISSIKIVCNGVTTNASGSGTSGSVSVVVGANALSTENSYPVNVTVTDQTGGVTISTTVAAMNYIFDVSPSGAAAFGAPAKNQSKKALNTVDFHIPPAFKNRPPMVTTSESIGANGNAGYIKILTFNNKAGVYVNSGIEFGFSQRGKHPCHVSFYITNANNTNLSVASISGWSMSDAFLGSCVYYRNPSANVLEFWVKKSEGYDEIYVTDVRYAYMRQPDVVYDLSQSFSSSLPSGCNAVGIRSMLGVPYNVVSNYYGMSLPNGTNTEWLRTTYNGIIPYQSGGASGLGTESWPFNNVWTNNLNWTGNGLTGMVMKQLWSGSWIAGNITVPNIKKYNKFLFVIGNNNMNGGWVVQVNRRIGYPESDEYVNDGMLVGVVAWPEKTNAFHICIVNVRQSGTTLISKIKETSDKTPCRSYAIDLGFVFKTDQPVRKIYGVL